MKDALSRMIVLERIVEQGRRESRFNRVASTVEKVVAFLALTLAAALLVVSLALSL